MRVLGSGAWVCSALLKTMDVSVASCKLHFDAGRCAAAPRVPENYITSYLPEKSRMKRQNLFQNIALYDRAEPEIMCQRIRYVLGRCRKGLSDGSATSRSPYRRLAALMADRQCSRKLNLGSSMHRDSET